LAASIIRFLVSVREIIDVQDADYLGLDAMAGMAGLVVVDRLEHLEDFALGPSGEDSFFSGC